MKPTILAPIAVRLAGRLRGGKHAPATRSNLGNTRAASWVRHRSGAFANVRMPCNADRIPNKVRPEFRASVANAAIVFRHACEWAGAHRVEWRRSRRPDYCHNCHVTPECFRAHKQTRGSVGEGPDRRLPLLWSGPPLLPRGWCFLDAGR